MYGAETKILGEGVKVKTKIFFEGKKIILGFIP
jgi:hypothetical protein